MSLRPSDVRAVFDSECTFPTDRQAVIDAVGTVEIVTPADETVTVRTVLERSEHTTYESLEELHSTLMTNLDDRHIGRKHYDDRSANPRRDESVSF